MAGQHRMVEWHQVSGQRHPVIGQQHPVVGQRAAHRPARPGSARGPRVVRGFTGLLAGGLVALAVAVGLAQWLVGSDGRPGPGMDVVTWHAVAAVAAVLLQGIADRSRGARTLSAAGCVLLITAAVLWFGWYA